LSDYQPLADTAKKYGLRAYVLEVDFALQSIFTPMQVQLEHMAATIEKYQKQYSFTQYNLMCHSQGAVLCRAYLQTYSNHSAQAFVSLSGPHMGQFGLTGQVEKFIPILRNVPRQEVYTLLYNGLAQNSFSVANYWKDPFHYSQYQSVVQFLPKMNNETSGSNPAAAKFRSNFLKLKQAAFLGSDADEIIEPPMVLYS
jgi:palmitoyl-protein thioesterase